MSKAAIFAQNVSTQTTSGGAVSFGSPVHGFGKTSCCQNVIDISGNNLALRDGGMYGIVISATVTASAPATITLQAYQDGVAFGVPQAVTIAAANDPAPVTLNLGPRVACNGSSIITLVATTTAGNVIIVGVETLAWKL